VIRGVVLSFNAAVTPSVVGVKDSARPLAGDIRGSAPESKSWHCSANDPA